MNAAELFLTRAAKRVARASALLGREVRVDMSALDRSDALNLQTPSMRSANGACRMIRCADAWLAINLPREEDLQSVPALLACDDAGDPWTMLAAHAPAIKAEELLERGALLGLAIARVGETQAPDRPCPFAAHGARKSEAPRVVDFSSLWAGPLCGSLFATLGADVLKIESAARPDTTAQSAPALDARLNGAKRKARLELKSEDGRALLLDEIAHCDVLITSARARALEGLGLTRQNAFAANPNLIWIAITGHGWASPRVAFGDDAAASGGLVTWHGEAPHFLGDAIADPLTGIAAAASAFEALTQNQAGFIDAALAQSAAFAAKLAP